MNVKLIFLFVLLIAVCICGFLIKGERFQMKQAATGKIVNVKRGFSFTYLFFGPLVPLFRGHIGGFFLTLFITLGSCGIGHLIMLFCYNGMYINWLVKNGYAREDALPAETKVEAAKVQAPEPSRQAEQERAGQEQERAGQEQDLAGQEQERIRQEQERIRQEQERIRQEQAREEWNRKRAELQGNIKEKAEAAQSAAVVYLGKGKEKSIEIYKIVKEKIVKLSSRLMAVLHSYLHEDGDERTPSDGGQEPANKLKLQAGERWVFGLGAFFTIMFIVSLFLDPRLHCQIHKWQYGMTQEQSEEYQNKIMQVQEENQEIIYTLDEKSGQKSEQEEEVKAYQAAYDKYTPDIALEEALASAYQNSTASAIECKAAILESLGVDTGISHYQEDDETGEGQRLQEYVVDEAVGQFASGTAGDILKSSLNGGIDGWSDNSSLSGVLKGINAVEAVAGFQDIDTISEHLLNTIAGEMETSSEKFRPCLDSDTLEKEELYQMIYWYYQYAKSASSLNDYSEGKSQSNIPGEAYHTLLLDEYETFAGNEALLHFLSAGEKDETK